MRVTSRTLYRKKWLSIATLLTTSLIFLSTITQAVDYQSRVVATGLNHPWSLAFLPNGSILVSELSGSFRIVDSDGNVSAKLTGTPEVVFRGQGGLSDILLDQDFENNSTFYFTYSAVDADQDNAVTLFIARARLEPTSIEDLEVIFRATAPRRAPVHFGAKLAWLPDGTLLITSGDGFDMREQAQSLDNHFGKLLRIKKDGGIPADNPFVKSADALHEIYSYGHRNPQGLVVLDNGDIFQHEHGPRGGDEINHIMPEKNYGWPAITYGVDYSGALISPFTARAGMEQPVKQWTPSIAPSGVMVYTGDSFPEWKGSMFVTALVSKDVRRITGYRDGATEEEELFSKLFGRLRNIYQTPEGNIMLVTDGAGGKLIEIAPR